MHVAAAGLAQGYIAARKADAALKPVGRRCCWCRHGADVFRIRCSLGDFVTTKLASCDHWEPR